MSNDRTTEKTETAKDRFVAPLRHRVRLAHGVCVGFTGVEAGNLGLHVQGSSDPQDNRRGLERAMAVRSGSLLFLEQVHGTHVARADDAPVIPPGLTPHQERELAPVADAAVTATGRPLAIMTADCLPIVLTTEHDSTFGVAHAGRKGLLAGVLPNVVEALHELGMRQIHAWVGPAICGRCYEVPRQMLEASAPGHPGIAATTRWNTPGLDLPAAAQAQLEGLGVEVHREVLNECTYEDEGLYSHRRAPGRGRIAGLVWTPGT
ncbi:MULTISPECIES: polyphenol oxidase family protein [Micrococcaceae]|uniref:polyphenol oxidase family protein n=1 Tax=unclassified Kocuria TaxID=2649579 RepID=UPI001011677B|nr:MULTISPECIES: polyphenol oxidase family protein [unclassified Kocuria]